MCSIRSTPRPRGIGRHADPARHHLAAAACHRARGGSGRFFVGGLIGVPIGVWLLVRTDAHALKFALGIFLARLSDSTRCWRRGCRSRAGGRAADAAVGFAGGILGGLGGYSGVLPTIWTQLRGWPKEAARGVYQPFIISCARGYVDAGRRRGARPRRRCTVRSSRCRPLALGAWLGWQLYGRLDERRFRQMLAVLLVVSGADAGVLGRLPCSSIPRKSKNSARRSTSAR